MRTERAPRKSRLLPTEQLWKAAAEVNEGIPNRWEVTTIGAVGDILNGFAFRSALFSEKQGTPLIRIRDLGKNSTETFYTGEFDPSYLVSPGSLLIGMDGDFRCVEWKGPEGLLNQRICKLSVNPDFLDPKLILFFINRHLQAIQSATSSLTVTHISSKTIAEIPFPLPPLNEQRRIATKIERLLKEVDGAKQAIARVSSLIDVFRQSILAKAFRGELTVPDPKAEPAQRVVERIRQSNRMKWEKELKRKGKDPEKYQYETIKPSSNNPPFKLPVNWEWTTIGDVFEVSVGGTPSRKAESYWGGNIPWVSSGEVAFSRIKDTREHITMEGVGNSSAKIRPPGTVLLAIIGEGKTRGQAAILDTAASTNQNVASIFCSEGPMPPEYVYWWLYYRYNETRSIGEGGAQPALNTPRVRAIPIPIAPLDEQKRIVSKVDELFASTINIVRAVKVAHDRVNLLEQSILTKAFRGDLVSPDPNDEPATVLLKRISSQPRPKQIKRHGARLGITKPQISTIPGSMEIRTIIDKMGGEAQVDRVFEASGLDRDIFWDKVGAEIKSRRIQRVQRGHMVFLRVKK
jgi:type I restriction enzyme S subunit